MLMELLYENASAPPGRRRARLPRRARHPRRAGRARRAAGRRPRRRGHRPRRRRGAAAAERPDLRRRATTRSPALGAVVVPVNPAFKQDELDFYFRQCDVRAVISDERSAGVCERIVAGWDRPAEVITTSAAHGQALTLDMLMRARARRLEPALARTSRSSTSSRRAPPAARSAWRAPTASASARPSLLRHVRASTPRTGSSARSRSSTPTAWAAACSRRRPPAPRS